MNDQTRPETGLKRIPKSPLPEGALDLMQITDCHLYANPEQRLLGLNTLESLREVVELVRTRTPPVAMVLATGDLVHDATPTGYRRLRQELGRLGVPVYCLPGNHDRPEVMREHLNQGLFSTQGSVDTPHWRLIMLDSVIPGSEGGRLAEGELERLDAVLAETPEHALVCLHHQPLPVRSEWLDTMALENRHEFFEVIDRHPQVRGILWGHIHQEYQGDYRHIPLLASPSTCIQFAPGSRDFRVDTLAPGCRFLSLLPDGTIRTRVERLEGYPEGLDLASVGY